MSRLLLMGWLCVVACTGSSSRRTEQAPESATREALASPLAGAWQAERGGSTRLFAFDANGGYRQLATMGPARTYAAGRWTQEGNTLRLTQVRHLVLVMGGMSKADLDAPKVYAVRLDAGSLVIDGATYARVPDAEAAARFPELPALEAANAVDREKLARMIEQLAAKRPTLTNSIPDALSFNDLLHEARREAAVLDAPELLDKAIAIHVVGDAMDACLQLGEAMEAAISYDSLRALTLLVGKGAADCGMMTEEHLRQARERGHTEAVSLIESKGKSRAALSSEPQPPGVAKLRAAASAGDYAMAKAWLDQGIDVNAADTSDPSRRTALMAAVQNGHADVVKLLVARGANVDMQDTHGQSALDRARERHPELVELLTGVAAATPPEPVLAKKVDYAQDPSQLDPGALINPDSPAPKPASLAPAAEPSTTSSTPSAPKQTASDKQKKRKCEEVKEQLARTRAKYAAQTKRPMFDALTVQQDPEHTKLAQEVLALELSYNLGGCP